MAKYRLCYRDYNDVYRAINLNGYEGILGEKVTDIESIDTLTTMFNSKEELLNFLREKSIEEFMQIKGIGKVKAIQLKAIFNQLN